MSTFIKEVDARTGLAGTNRMELLVFQVGTDEIFGINVFKVREVMKVPPLTRMPEADPRIAGMANIRGTMVPVIDLKRTLGMDCNPRDAEGGVRDAVSGTREAGGNLIVAEYNMSVQAFRVCSVDRILRLSWTKIRMPPPLLRDTVKGMVTAVAMLDDGRMVLILDVEKILAEICPKPDQEVFAGMETNPQLKVKRVLFADDSMVARTQIRKTLERLGMDYLQATTGLEAWELLTALAEKVAAEGKSVRDEVHLILTDIEMPDMDGFTLTRQIRSDPRFAGIPILLHSSLTGTCNREKGKAVGATDYVTKFDPKCLGEMISRYVERS